jgi:hypothetical protein
MGVMAILGQQLHCRSAEVISRDIEACSHPRAPATLKRSNVLLLSLGVLRCHSLPLAISLDPCVRETILAAYILPLIRAPQRVCSYRHSGVVVNMDFQVAQLLGLDFEIARTQIHLVLRLVGDAAARVRGDNVIGFILINCGCAFLYGRLCPVLLMLLDPILGANSFGCLLTGGERHRKQAQRNSKQVFIAPPLESAILLSTPCWQLPQTVRIRRFFNNPVFSRRRLTLRTQL